MYKVTIESECGKWSGKAEGIDVDSLMKALKKAMKKEGWSKKQRKAIQYDHSVVLRELENERW